MIKVDNSGLFKYFSVAKNSGGDPNRLNTSKFMAVLSLLLYPSKLLYRSKTPVKLFGAPSKINLFILDDLRYWVENAHAIPPTECPTIESAWKC